MLFTMQRTRLLAFHDECSISFATPHVDLFCRLWMDDDLYLVCCMPLQVRARQMLVGVFPALTSGVTRFPMDHTQPPKCIAVSYSSQT